MCAAPAPKAAVRAPSPGEVSGVGGPVGETGRECGQGVRKSQRPGPRPRFRGKLREPEDSLSAPEPAPPGRGQKVDTKDH